MEDPECIIPWLLPFDSHSSEGFTVEGYQLLSGGCGTIPGQKGSPQRKDCLANSSRELQSLMEGRAWQWWQEQDVGRSHFIPTQETESKQEVR